jgi:hypothetical protein
LTPSSRGADKNANAPVSGNNVPIFNGSAAAADESLLESELASELELELELELESSSSPHAAATRTKANKTARSLNRRLFFMFISPHIIK